MKKLLIVIFLLISVITQGQDDRRKKDSMILFAPTEKGEPDGEPVSEKIGNNGGRIISSDKKVEIIIPAGALQKETTISIQPVTSLSPAAIGKTYRFEPSGLQFKIPAKLVFNYSDQDTTDGSPQLMSVSTQDAKGSWLRLTDVKVDTELKTVTGNINHFSGYTMSWTLVMWAHRNKVKVGNEIGVEMYLTPINRPLEDASIGEFINAYGKWFGNKKGDENRRLWSVNGILRGNSTVGKIIDIKDEYNVIYKAPSKLPDSNPVEIQVEIKGVEVDYRYMNVTRKCKVLVYDAAYEVTLVSSMKGSAGSVGGALNYKDNGSFIITLNGKETKIIEKVNTSAYWNYKGSKCTIVQLKQGSGSIHVAGIESTKITQPSSGAEPAIIEIMFSRYPTIWPLLQFTCPNRIGGTFTSTSAQANAIMASLPALPQHIKFKAIEEEQTCVQFGEEGGEYYLKITIKQVKDD